MYLGITIDFLSVSAFGYFPGARYFTDFFAAWSIASGRGKKQTDAGTGHVSEIGQIKDHMRGLGTQRSGQLHLQTCNRGVVQVADQGQCHFLPVLGVG